MVIAIHCRRHHDQLIRMIRKAGGGPTEILFRHARGCPYPLLLVTDGQPRLDRIHFQNTAAFEFIFSPKEKRSHGA
jgi:hypothetical protein